MFSDEVKKNLFKVKKITINGVDVQGVVTPSFNTYTGKFNEELNLITPDERHRIWNVRNQSIKTTKVTNEKLKKILEEIIVEEKKKYKLFLEIVKLEEQKKKICEKVSKIDSHTDVLRNKAIKAQGFISDEEFNDSLKDVLKKYYGYSLEPTINSRKIIELKLTKEVDVYRWVKEGTYDFLYEEYDGTIFVEHDLLPKSKDMSKLKSEHFRKINTKKIGSHMIKESFDAYVGDKRTLGISHEIKLTFKKGIELRKENLKEIKKTINEFTKII